MQWAQFLTKIIPDLLSLAKELFKRHSGDLEAARKDIQSRKVAIARDREEADREIARLKQEKRS